MRLLSLPFARVGLLAPLMFAAAAVCGVPATDRPHLPARADFLLLGSTAAGAFGSVVDVIDW